MRCARVQFQRHHNVLFYLAACSLELCWACKKCFFELTLGWGSALRQFVKLSSLLKGSSAVACLTTYALRVDRQPVATSESGEATLGQGLPELKPDEGL